MFIRGKTTITTSLYVLHASPSQRSTRRHVRGVASRAVQRGEGGDRDADVIAPESGVHFALLLLLLLLLRESMLLQERWSVRG